MKFEQILPFLREGKKARPNKYVPWFYIKDKLLKQEQRATKNLCPKWLLSDEWEIEEEKK